jgi:hypothetical protein
MEIHLNRLKLLLGKRSFGGWLLLILGVGWEWLEHLHTAIWILDRLFPSGWPKIMFHPHYVTIGLLIAGFVWLTLVLVLPGRQEIPNPWLEFDTDINPSDERILRLKNAGDSSVFDVVVKIPSDGSRFVSDPINRIENNKSWVPIKRNRGPAYLGAIRDILVQTILASNDPNIQKIPVLISYRDHRHQTLELEIPLPLKDGIQFALPRAKSKPSS